MLSRHVVRRNFHESITTEASAQSAAERYSSIAARVLLRESFIFHIDLTEFADVVNESLVDKKKK